MYRYIFLYQLLGCPGEAPAPVTFACGTTTCAADDLCIEEHYAPTCENRTDTGTPCPDGTTATMCGGAGMPCCCEPEPEPTWSCQAGTCAEATCDCVTCPENQGCTSQTDDRTFVCEDLPAP